MMAGLGQLLWTAPYIHCHIVKMASLRRVKRWQVYWPTWFGVFILMTRYTNFPQTCYLYTLGLFFSFRPFLVDRTIQSVEAELINMMSASLLAHPLVMKIQPSMPSHRNWEIGFNTLCCSLVIPFNPKTTDLLRS